jgi:hypothetical protein
MILRFSVRVRSVLGRLFLGTAMAMPQEEYQRSKRAAGVAPTSQPAANGSLPLVGVMVVALSWGK